MEQVATQVARIPMPDDRYAARLEAMADNLQKEIDRKRGPRLTNTPKRQKEDAIARIDANNLERGQRAMRALADALRRGRAPGILVVPRTKPELLRMVAQGFDSRGYYSICPNGKYSDASLAGRALQDLMEAAADAAVKQRDAERARGDKLRSMLAEASRYSIDGYFPTPAPVGNQMCDIADLRAGLQVLEPCAGSGELVAAILDNEPGAEVYGVEINHRLNEICQLRFYGDRRVVISERDFWHDIGDRPGERYDRVIMNPPFENNADAKFVGRAFGMLRPGGILVSVVSAAVKFADRYANFRMWIDAQGGELIDLPEGSFKPSGTSVNALLLRVTK